MCAPAALTRMRSLVRFELAPLGRAPHESLTLRPVRFFRRALLVLGVAALIGWVARLRGKGELPATEGGWRELDGPEFR